MSLFYSKLVFPISSALKAKYNTAENTSLFSGDNYVVFISPEDYVPEYNYGNYDLLKGFNSYTVQNNNPVYTVNVTVQDQRIANRYLLEELIILEKANLYSRAMTTVYDYHEVEIDDRETGYTIRKGFLDFNNKGGTFRSQLATTGATFIQGLSFKFTQVA